ncbi:hypothetical protein [uncultured Methanobrevibacter sp.]|uniref:hypothetical protein n=1 Tax=uncultured Methanobrevibacter sp. TaxID=253161 RepID=UPI0025EF5151|nr:hypothetical protein [uncultured Methanobrevibacter sp.]
MDYELRLPNGVGEVMLARAFEKFDVELKQSEYGPSLIGSKEELEKAQKFIYDEMEKRLNELEEK